VEISEDKIVSYRERKGLAWYRDEKVEKERASTREKDGRVGNV